LSGHIRDDAGRHIGGIDQKGAEEARGADLDGHAEQGMILAAGLEQHAIGVIEVEVARELDRGGFLVVAPVAGSLLLG
jgi:hypothetical protein